MDKFIYVVGIGDDGEAGLFPETLQVIAGATVLVGGERHLAFFPNFRGEQVVLKGSMAKTFETIAAMYPDQQVVVLASGDPLFYGIGGYVIKRFGAERVCIMPHLSSMQLAFARAGLSWQDAHLLSLHGRKMQGLAQKVNGREKIALLTDGDNTPAAIARYLQEYNMTEYDLFVAENLGSEGEQVGWYTITEATEREFSPLNVVILKRHAHVEPHTYPLGIADDEFSQRKPDRGLITKREIRVLSLAELHLKPGSVMWDIGACTGSVSIEATLHTPGLRAFAIEKNVDDLVNLRENQVKFRTDFVAVHGRAPDKLAEFDDPDAVFIGGSGGELAEVLLVCADRLRPDGRIVVNAATIETLHLAQQTLQNFGFQVDISLVQTARSKPILNLTRFEGMNPVYLVTARRQEVTQKSAPESEGNADA